jgi:hypothetical protein
MSKRYPGGVIRKTPATPTQSSASGVWGMTDVTQAQQTNNWPVANVPNPMSRSLRFRASATAYMNRTPTVAGNKKTWTYSAWVKRGTLGTSQSIFYATPDGSTVAWNGTNLWFDSSNQLRLQQANSPNTYYVTSAVFRDPSAWYHIVVAVDTTQATAGNRAIIYVNGVSQTLTIPFGSGYAQNDNTWVNGTYEHDIGSQNDSPRALYLDGYLAEVNFVDGQALTPTSFGQYDQFGNWTSKQYTGTYGTNGFYLPFKNNSSTGTLGLDFSGNNNTWTTNNFSVTPTYQYTTYTSSSGTYTVPAGVSSIQYLVVAGGGGAGGNAFNGGGGAGGLLTGTMSVTPGQTLSYSVGAGGAGGTGGVNGSNGSNSTFGGLTAIGGGAGGSTANGAGASGGSGGGGAGGSSGTGAAGAGTSGQGQSGGVGFGAGSGLWGAGGGGGAGVAGVSGSSGQGGNGGAGITWINGTTYAGGGGGSTGVGNTAGVGGAGGGGAASNSSNGTSGTANTGGGGGGASGNNTGGSGGSGIIIIANAVGNSTYDSMTDVPTQWTPYNVTGDVGGIIRGNYAVLNPLAINYGITAGYYTMSNGNLFASATGTEAFASTTIQMESGKYYAEFYVNLKSSTSISQFGIATLDLVDTRVYRSDGNYNAGAGNVAYGATYTTGDTVAVAVDITNNTIEFFKNGTSQGQKTGISTAGKSWFFWIYSGGGNSSWYANYGQYAFTYAPPSGYKSLCTTNLPTPTIQQGNLVMDATLWTGNGSTQTITNAAPFKPDFVWIKQRSGTGYHVLEDTVRGATKNLSSNSTDPEATIASGLTSFNSNGFSLGSNGDVNASAGTYVGWQWQAGQGTTSSNTSGSITSTVSVNATAGFSVVTYAGLNAGGTIGHGLGVTPSMVIFKNRTSSPRNWRTYHTSLGFNFVDLNTTAAVNTSDTGWIGVSSSVLTVTGGNDYCATGSNFVAYCWSEIAGFSKFGSYVGNGNANGPFIYTGFRPRFILIKRSDSTANWYIFDTARDTYNAAGLELYPNLSNAEADGRPDLDILSNGFKIRSTSGGQNATNGTFIYAAFAEYPLKSALAR